VAEDIMNSMAITGLALVVIGVLSILLRHSLARWARRYFNRFGELGAGFGELIRPHIYGAGGGLFVIFGLAMVIFSFIV
jgi:amino acid transporter